MNFCVPWLLIHHMVHYLSPSTIGISMFDTIVDHGHISRSNLLLSSVESSFLVSSTSLQGCFQRALQCPSRCHPNGLVGIDSFQWKYFHLSSSSVMVGSRVSRSVTLVQLSRSNWVIISNSSFLWRGPVLGGPNIDGLWQMSVCRMVLIQSIMCVLTLKRLQLMLLLSKFIVVTTFTFI